MPNIQVATINIFSDLSRWKQRRQLLVDGLAASGAEMIAIQEAHIRNRTAQWLAEQLGMPYCFLAPKSGKAGRDEGIAILSRLPFAREEVLDLKTQNRVAQRVQVEVQGQSFIFANGHFFWQPGPSPERQAQVLCLLNWLDEYTRQMPAILCGDFNGLPDEPWMTLVQASYRSAYAEIHGREPEYTTPTPLPRSKWQMIKTLLTFFGDIRWSKLRRKWKGTLDYIFVNRFVQVQKARLILNQPSPQDGKIYPSDHFGLWARLVI